MRIVVTFDNKIFKELNRLKPLSGCELLISMVYAILISLEAILHLNLWLLLLNTTVKTTIKVIVA